MKWKLLLAFAVPVQHPLFLPIVSVASEKHALFWHAGSHFVFLHFISVNPQTFCSPNFFNMSDAHEPHQMLFICTGTFYANQSSSGQPQDMCQPLPRFFKTNTVPAKTCHYCLTFCEREPVFCVSQTHVWQNVNQPTESGHMGSIWKVRNSSQRPPNQSWVGALVGWRKFQRGIL